MCLAFRNGCSTLCKYSNLFGCKVASRRARRISARCPFVGLMTYLLMSMASSALMHTGDGCRVPVARYVCIDNIVFLLEFNALDYSGQVRLSET